MSDLDLAELRSQICIKAGLRSITPADCKRISLEINKATSRNVSETTLKRLFGFANAKFNFSRYTISSIFEYTEKI
ncbi:hypothetical protein [Pedobacter sp. B4-66]|uniref:hypothetical protein n=1 Tax=Pedobacter sp. B4-66 TaxID=2817280 RepID=UPI001BD986D3|nr:hypothetical protein [Pedobacter sp. B4-66]